MNFFKYLNRRYQGKKLKKFNLILSFFLIVFIAFIIRTFVFGLYQVPSGSMETTLLVGERFFADKFTPLFMPLKDGDIVSFNDPTFNYSRNPLVNWWQMNVWGPTNWTKRVIGVPGDHIKGFVEDGRPAVYRNDQRLNEPYLNANPLIATYNFYRDPSYVFKSFVSTIPLDLQPYYVMTMDEIKLGKHKAVAYKDASVRHPNTPLLGFGTLGERKGKPLDEYDIQLGPDEYWVMGDNRKGSCDSRDWGVLKRNMIHGKILFRLYSIDTNESWFILGLIKHPIKFFSQIRWRRCFQLVH